jgi:hypothetical protein
VILGKDCHSLTFGRSVSLKVILGKDCHSLTFGRSVSLKVILGKDCHSTTFGRPVSVKKVITRKVNISVQNTLPEPLLSNKDVSVNSPVWNLVFLVFY